MLLRRNVSGSELRLERSEQYCDDTILRGAKGPTVKIMHALASLHEHISLIHDFDVNRTQKCTIRPNIKAEIMATLAPKDDSQVRELNAFTKHKVLRINNNE